eukprot:326661-Rhodomonas_salina.1
MGNQRTQGCCISATTELDAREGIPAPFLPPVGFLHPVPGYPGTRVRTVKKRGAEPCRASCQLLGRKKGFRTKRPSSKNKI